MVLRLRLEQLQLKKRHSVTTSFTILLLFAAFRVITARNPVHAALFLVLAFFQAAAIWILLKAEFLAITLVLVYVGAVMVLFCYISISIMFCSSSCCPLSTLSSFSSRSSRPATATTCPSHYSAAVFRFISSRLSLHRDRATRHHA